MQDLSRIFIEDSCKKHYMSNSGKKGGFKVHLVMLIISFALQVALLCSKTQSFKQLLHIVVPFKGYTFKIVIFFSQI